MSGPIPKCVLDRSRPCNSCVADNPSVCPYPYLLAEAEPVGGTAEQAA